MNPADTLTLPLFDHLSTIAERISAAGRAYLFLDFDGTLAPIVDDPSSAALPAETKRLLDTLTRSARFCIAIISGRSVADLQKRVALPQLIYAGDHGFAIRGPGVNFVEPAAAGLLAPLAGITRQLETRLEQIPGALVENKGLTASIHFRAAREMDRPLIYQIAAKTLAAHGDLFRLFQGLSALDIRPAVHWNKGAATQWLLTAAGSPPPLPIYLGDDFSDEDAFVALQSGVTIRIGRTGDTAAQYQLDFQEAVAEFLSWLIEFDRNPSLASSSPNSSSKGSFT